MGTIVFQDGTAPISSAISLSNGIATFSTASLSMGVNTLIAVYSGNLAANGSSGGSNCYRLLKLPEDMAS